MPFPGRLKNPRALLEFNTGWYKMEEREDVRGTEVVHKTLFKLTRWIYTKKSHLTNFFEKLYTFWYSNYKKKEEFFVFLFF